MKIVLVGVSGYAEYYFTIMERFLGDMEFSLDGVADPYAKKSPRVSWLAERGIPIYSTLEEYYRERSADLAIICSPIPFHREQSVTAMKHGSAVLCEKPLTATLEEALVLWRQWLEEGIPFGVGFQWSFSPTMQRLKKDILAGKLGKPLQLKTQISWKRDDAYYDPRGWKGRLHDSAGRAVMDSVAMNATAHYLHNILFLLGDSMDQAAMPVWIAGGAYRARPIESYDTCFLRGELPRGCEMIYCASHVGEVNSEPRFLYRFEQADVIMGEDTGFRVVARWRDGTETDYGAPQSMEETAHKLRWMIRSAGGGEAPACGIDTSLPHLAVCKAVREGMPVRDFPAELLEREDSPPGVHVRGLCHAMDQFYRTGRLPGEQGLPWGMDSGKIAIPPLNL